ncbi:phosphoenolpyruvate synthase [Patescibacteria group bacterium]|nr:phosphoenolpyruvate synthase [Patescibacteria group bacterium]
MGMKREKKFVLWFEELGINDIPLVGGKNAAIGEMYSNLVPLGIGIPNGFALTAYAYRFFFEKTGLDDKIKEVLSDLNTHDIRNLRARGASCRKAILSTELPIEIKKILALTYKQLEKKYGKRVDVAVRSSATAEDLPDASFAGQQETFLNISGEEALEEAVHKCIASLFTDRAISYRTDKGFCHFDTALSVGVQKMVRSDLASSGVIFTLDTESGFDKVVVINSVYGLGEMIVQGRVIPDEFIVFKPTLEKGFKSIIAQDLGVKDKKMVYASKETKVVDVSKKDQEAFSLTNQEVLKLADWSVKVEKHFSAKKGKYQAMDIEWAKDGKTQKLFIVQARPETVHSSKDPNVYQEFKLKKTGKLLFSGIAVGKKIASGKVRVIKDTKNMLQFKKGEILVTEITDPDWEPIMKIASAIITDKGGRTSHAAIVSRELGIPCIVGSEKATRLLKDGVEITVDCASSEEGRIYKGKLPFIINKQRLNKIPKIKTKVMLNIGSPGEAFKNSHLPVSGVGLGRLEFIIASHIGIHPNALINYQKIKKQKNTEARKIIKEIDKRTPSYKIKSDFYIDELAEGIAKIAAAFWPNDVIIRFSDFKTNEYSKLVGGSLYEPQEENPMIGWRGASRYYDPKFKEAFGLECKAFKKVREVMGLVNIVPMVPFCRTPEEGQKVLGVMKEYGLSRSPRQSASSLRKSALEGLKVYVMCEIPSNILLADEFLEIFDGMSIGSNDLTQLVLGMDRDSGVITHIANENNEAVKKMVADIITKCTAKKKYIGICGQAPSDYPEFTAFLVEKGIESISLTPDTIIKNILMIAEKEKGK